MLIKNKTCAMLIKNKTCGMLIKNKTGQTNLCKLLCYKLDWISKIRQGIDLDPGNDSTSIIK